MRNSLNNVLSFVVFSFVLITGCYSIDLNTNATATAVPDSRILLEQMLFKPEDLGWPDRASRLDDEFPDTADQHSDFLRIVAFPYEGSASRIRYGANQSIWAYPTNQLALDFYDYSYQLQRPTNFSPPIEFEPKTENVAISCHYTDMLGGFYNCAIIIQVGSYFSLASMDVDEDTITFQDWERFLNVVQDRFIQYASSSIE